MHSLMHRGNTALTFFLTVAAALAILTSMTGELVHVANLCANPYKFIVFYAGLQISSISLTLK